MSSLNSPVNQAIWRKAYTTTIYWRCTWPRVHGCNWVAEQLLSRLNINWYNMAYVVEGSNQRWMVHGVRVRSVDAYT
jgi:hypothetical protein